MRFDYMNYKSQFDSSVLKDMKSIDEKINKITESPEQNHDELLKLKIQKWYRGMSLCAGYANNYKRGIPY